MSNNNELNDVKFPICPMSMYFEGDEDKCDEDLCDYEYTTRSCSQGCEGTK